MEADPSYSLEKKMTINIICSACLTNQEIMVAGRAAGSTMS